jgi:hypothetical protein
MDLKKEVVHDWIQTAENTDQGMLLWTRNEPSVCLKKAGDVLTTYATISFSSTMLHAFSCWMLRTYGKHYFTRTNAADMMNLTESICIGYCLHITSWSLRSVNVVSAVRGEYKGYRWTEEFLLVNDKKT